MTYTITAANIHSNIITTFPVKSIMLTCFTDPVILVDNLVESKNIVQNAYKYPLSYTDQSLSNCQRSP
jgi:hypothetical protein